MHIEIIGTESLGVRGMCCYVETGKRKILIDPGIALGYKRHDLLPHPYQVARGERIRKKIIDKWSIATDVVFSHFHGDHIPLTDANPYQLDINELVGLNDKIRFYTSDLSDISGTEKIRAQRLSGILKKEFITAEGSDFKDISFSERLPHGNKKHGGVMMTKIKDDKTFVHASDIQLFDDRSVSALLDWKPDIIFADGPPVYLLGRVSKEDIDKAFNNALSIAKEIPVLILDHHLLRCREGMAWLDTLSEKSFKKIICGADFMQCPRNLLEARRKDLYKDMPVPGNWHKMYADGLVNTDLYWGLAKELYF